MSGQVVQPSRPRTPSKDTDSVPIIKPKQGLKDVEREIKLGEDEPGCKDSELLPRIPGCSVIQCDTKPEAEDVDIQVGIGSDGSVQTESMDGSAEILYYLCPARITVGSVVRISDAALSKVGYKIVYQGHDGDDFPIVTALKDNQWIQVSTYNYNEHTAYVQTAIKVTPESGATAEALAEEMNKNGRVVLTEGLFDGSAREDLAPDAEKVLSTVAALLVRQPDWRIRVEGHLNATDADSKSGLLDLSQKRASSVAQWLMEHGLDKSRITIQGLGDSKPSGDSATPEGQVKNRRIELVKF